MGKPEFKPTRRELFVAPALLALKKTVRQQSGLEDALFNDFPQLPDFVPPVPDFEQEPDREVIELSPLELYLQTIEQEQAQLRKVVEEYNLISPLKDLIQAEQLEDFEIYYPIYKAGEQKYNIPWFLLWIIHEHETVASRDVAPERSGYRGSMQLAPMHMNNPYIYNAPQEYEFLDEINSQRYLRRNGWLTNDWEEILRGAAYTRLFADSKKLADDEAAILSVVRNNYSAVVYGRQREAQYLKIKPLLTNG